MEIQIPSDCGNSPRMLLVAQWAVDWAAGTNDAAHALLADDTSWTFVGDTRWEGAAERVEILTVLNHGKSAACEGIVTLAKKRVAFSHFLRFTGAAKTAKVAAIRSYLIST